MGAHILNHSREEELLEQVIGSFWEHGPGRFVPEILATKSPSQTALLITSSRSKYVFILTFLTEE